MSVSLKETQFYTLGNNVRFEPNRITIMADKKYLANIDNRCQPVTILTITPEFASTDKGTLTPQQFYDCIGKIENDIVENVFNFSRAEVVNANTTTEDANTANIEESTTTEYANTANIEESTTTEYANTEYANTEDANTEDTRKKKAAEEARKKKAAEEARKKAKAAKAARIKAAKMKLLQQKREELTELQNKCVPTTKNVVLQEQSGGLKVTQQITTECTQDDQNKMNILQNEIKNLEKQLHAGGKRRTKKRSRKLKRKSKRSKPSKKSKRSKKR